MTEQNFVDQKIKELIKNGYKRNQAYLVAKSMYTKQYAQQAIDYNKEYMAMTPEQEQLKSGQFVGYGNSFPQGIEYNFNSKIPTPQNPFENTGYANYAQTLEQNNPLPQSDFRGYQQYNTLDPNFKPSNTLKKPTYPTTSGNSVDTTQRNEVNIMNPFSGVSLDESLTYAGQGFGEGDPYKAGIGTSLSLLKGARGFMSGYANGKESKRVANANRDTQYEQNRNYTYSAQQGGKKLTNAENLTGQFVADEGVGNVNMENDEFVKRTTGQVQQVVGENHVRNGKEAEGVDVNLEDGDKTLSNTKILPIGAKNAKELKDRYNITVKAKDTFASVQKKVDSKIGYKKETEELSSWIEKFGDNEKLKDKTTKELNAPIIEKKMLASKAKIEALNEVRGMVFEDLYNRQEQIPKKGKPGDLFTDSGKLVTEKNEGVAQQGGEQEGGQAMQIIQAYAEASGQDPQALAEQIGQMQPEEQQQALQQMVQELQGGQGQGEQNQSSQEEQQEMTAQQGGLMEMASKYGISNERAQELVNLQQGGEEKIAPQRPIKFIQQVSTEGYRDNNRLAPGDYQKVYYTDPQNAKIENQDYEYLTDSGYDMLKKMNNYRIYMEQKNKVVPQNNQIAGINQQGGEKDYYQLAGEYNPNKPYGKDWTKDDQKTRYEAFLQQARLLGYEGKLTDKDFDKDKAWGELQNFIADKAPQETEAYAKGTRMTAKGVGILKKSNPEIFKKTGISTKKPDEDYSEEEVTLLAQELENSGKTPKDFWVNQFKDGRRAYRAPMVATNLQAKGMANTSQTQAPTTTTDMSKFYSTPKEGAVQVDAQGQPIPQETVDENGVKNYMPSFPVDLRMPPSALSALNKPYVPFGRQEPIKATAEPMLAEQERLRQTDLERINQTGLSPQQMEALSASGLASSQMASNDAIGKVENFNAQNQFQTDQFNIGQRTKEDTINTQFSQKYQDQMLGSMDAYERNWRNYYTEGNLQNRMNYNYVNDLNKANAMSDQYAIVPGQGVIFKNNQSQNLSLGHLSDNVWSDMTSQEQIDWVTNQNYATKKKAATK